MDSCWCQPNKLASSVLAMLPGRAVPSDTDGLRIAPFGTTQPPHAANLGHVQSYPDELALKVSAASSGDEAEAGSGMQMARSLICSSFSEISPAAGGDSKGTRQLHHVLPPNGYLGLKQSSRVEGRKGN